MQSTAASSSESSKATQFSPSQPHVGGACFYGGSVEIMIIALYKRAILASLFHRIRLRAEAIEFQGWAIQTHSNSLAHFRISGEAQGPFGLDSLQP